MHTGFYSVIFSTPHTQRILRAILAGLIIFVAPADSNSGTWGDPLNYTSTGPEYIRMDETYFHNDGAHDIYDIFLDIIVARSTKNTKTALKKLIFKARSGNPEAQALLANLYGMPFGVEGLTPSPNNRKMAQWMHKAVQGMRKAAERGDSTAQYILGVYYESGQGVPGSYAEAAKWYRKAAQQGHSQASFRLGRLYDNGDGVAQDYAQAVYWYRKAIQKKTSDDYYWAAHSLGEFYHHGLTVPKNLVLALALYLVPDCDHMSSNDRDRLSGPFDDLKIMTSRQIEDAQFLCDTMWKDGIFDVMEQYLTAMQSSPDSKKANTSSHSPD